MSTHIDLQGNESRHAAMLRSAVDSLRSLQDQYRKLSSIMAAVGAGGSYEENMAFIQAAYGLKSADDAIMVNYLIGEVNTVLQTNDKVAALLSRLG